MCARPRTTSETCLRCCPAWRARPLVVRVPSGGARRSRPAGTQAHAPPFADASARRTQLERLYSGATDMSTVEVRGRSAARAPSARTTHPPCSCRLQLEPGLQSLRLVGTKLPVARVPGIGVYLNDLLSGVCQLLSERVVVWDSVGRLTCPPHRSCRAVARLCAPAGKAANAARGGGGAHRAPCAGAARAA